MDDAGTVGLGRHKDGLLKQDACSVKDFHPIEPLDVEDIAELLVSTEAAVDTCGPFWKIGWVGPEPKKWSSLAVALFMCALAAAIFAAGKPQPV